ncbi:MAG: Stf0 family sulfotransferase [Pseudomonadota bacterium]
MICTTPRSGSTLLCGLLSATRVAGMPASHFHTPSLAGWLKAYGLEHAIYASERDAARAVVDAGIERGKGSNGVFGLRMQRDSFMFFMSQADLLCPGLATDRARLEALFGPTLLIYLRRDDGLAQAVSLVVAKQTGLWHRNADGSELERQGRPGTPCYDASAIAQHVAELTALNAAWEAWFSREKLTPFRITYEALSNNPRGVLADLLAALSLDPSLADGVAIPTARLADATNASWIDRFRATAPGQD